MVAGVHRTDDVSDNSRRDVDDDVVAELLDDPVRRQLVEHLHGTSGEGLQYLSILLTRSEARRRGTSVVEVGFDRMQREVEQTHIPVLEEAGVLSFNEESEWVSLDPAARPVIESVLDDG